MQASNPYEEVGNLLVDGGFYPALSFKVKNKIKIIEGLRIDSPPVLMEERGQRIKKIVGDNYIVTWMGSEVASNFFLIKKKPF